MRTFPNLKEGKVSHQMGIKTSSSRNSQCSGGRNEAVIQRFLANRGNRRRNAREFPQENTLSARPPSPPNATSIVRVPSGRARRTGSSTAVGPDTQPVRSAGEVHRQRPGPEGIGGDQSTTPREKGVNALASFKRGTNRQNSESGGGNYRSQRQGSTGTLQGEGSVPGASRGAR